MLTKMECQYYLVRIRDSWYRIGFHKGTKNEHRGYLESIGTYEGQPKADIVYLGQLPLPIKDDIDVGSGLGTKHIGESIVVTCKFQKMMMTIKQAQDKTFLELQKQCIVSIRRTQREVLTRKLEVEARRLADTLKIS